MFDFITTTALVWTVYIFLFSEADKQLAELLRRIRFAVSVLPNGKIDPEQLQLKQHLSPQDIVDLGEVIDDAQHKTVIKRFAAKYSDVENWKNVLLLNISLLTLLVLIASFYRDFCLRGWVQVHLIASLLLGGYFYFILSKLPRQRFSQVTRAPSV